MMIKRTFRGRDYLLGKWIHNLILVSNERIEFSDSFSMDGTFEITLTYDNLKIKRLIRKAYKEMQKGRI